MITTLLAPGMIVNHHSLGVGTVQKTDEQFHPHFKEFGLCYIKLKEIPSNWSETVLVDVEALTPIKAA